MIPALGQHEIKAAKLADSLVEHPRQ